MPYPVIVVNSFKTTKSDDILMTAAQSNVIEDRPLKYRYYNFNMVITQPFPFNSTSRLVFTDDAGVDTYYLIDRLNKPVIANELQNYASNRRCIACQFDSVTKTVKVFSCLCPTDKYINEWLDPTSSKDPVDPTLPTPVVN